RDVKHKLAFVPAGHEYREWQEPRTRGRIVYFYFDPAKMPIDPGAGPPGAPLAPRVFFADKALWGTAVKLGRVIGSGRGGRACCSAATLVRAASNRRRAAVSPPGSSGSSPRTSKNISQSRYRSPRSRTAFG